MKRDNSRMCLRELEVVVVGCLTSSAVEKPYLPAGASPLRELEFVVVGCLTGSAEEKPYLPAGASPQM